MPKTRLRSFRRHLLAVCTFVVPLGILAWLGFGELRRQGSQVRDAIEREAMQFLRSAAQAVDRQLDSYFLDACRESVGLLAEHPPATAARLLRTAGYGAVRDIVLLNESARLSYPMPAGPRASLPFATDIQPGGEETALALQVCDLAIARGRLADAERELQHALDQLAAAPAGRGRRIDAREFEVMLNFRLATVQQRLGHERAALDRFAKVGDMAQTLRPVQGRGRNHFNALSCALLAALVLAEHDPEPAAARLRLLEDIAMGRHDHPLADTQLLQAVAQRAAAGLQDRAVELAMLDVATHLGARAFASEFDQYQRERLRDRLRRLDSLPPDDPTDDQPLLELPFAPEGDGSVLVLRRARDRELETAAWVGLRFGLTQLLTGVIDRYVRGDGSFVLAIADGDDQPIVPAPPTPADFTAPMLVSHGLHLSAYPADWTRHTTAAEAAARNAMWLALGLFGVATIGALWLWRSVSRESELLALKVDLVSRVSHELKTPLALISLYGETLGLKRVRDAEQASQFGSIITREAERLTTMIQRILDFSRRESGAQRYQPEVTDLGAALAEIAAAHAPHLQAKGAELTTDLAAGLTVRVDRAALHSAVVNLLENAVKYAREDAPDLTLRVEARRRGATAEIDVLDRGRGVPERERERVFDSFYRASNAGEVRGVGLGLSLVRDFAAAHGGTAGVQARPGGGSIFRITLPIHHGDATAT